MFKLLLNKYINRFKMYTHKHTHTEFLLWWINVWYLRAKRTPSESFLCSSADTCAQHICIRFFDISIFRKFYPICLSWDWEKVSFCVHSLAFNSISFCCSFQLFAHPSEGRKRKNKHFFLFADRRQQHLSRKFIHAMIQFAMWIH